MAQDKKTEAIIEAAQKRFAHFGVSKTTMTEIADDLAISKASLYYYFPDKLNLYAAVLQTIIEAEATHIEEYAAEKDPVKIISLYLDYRTQFINKYYNILQHLRNLSADIPKELKGIFSMARTRELNTITSIFEQGKAAKKLKMDDTAKTAELFLDCLDGLRYSVFSQRANFFPEKKQFQALLKREKEMATIFFKGLSY